MLYNHQKTEICKMYSQHRTILFFDGHCNLCNGAVRFVLNNEKGGTIYLAPLQGETSRAYLPTALPDSLVLLENGKIFIESSAALKLIPYFKWHFQWLRILWIFPKFLRNWIYRFVAKNRIHWFGKSQYCAVMQPKWKDRFLP
jgi:predicted DCC family thiol-disulfide oxidoreductase YuxK